MVKFSNNEDGDEQKRDDVHESPLVSTGRIPSVELPNETSPTSSILKKGELLGDGKVLKSSLSPEKSTDENLKLNTPQSEQRSTVSFTGIGAGDSVAGDIPIGASREESLERELQQLRGKLTQVQIDLQAEKATRKRKEKNLFKLAKELNKRTAEIDFKDVQIKRLTDTVNQMEERKLATGLEAFGNDRELAAAQQKYRAACRDYDGLLEATQQEHDETCRELNGQIKEANKQVHFLTNELASTDSPPVPIKKSVEPRQSSGIPKPFALVGFVVAVLLAILYQFDLLSMDAVCAPAMPGTTLDTQDAIFEAPWWAPPLQKEPAFEALCGGRTRSRLVASGGKLTAYSLLDNDSGTELWHRRATTARVGSRRLTLRDKRGHAEHVESPWLL